MAEALTNVVKHSRAGSAEVTASVKGGALRVEIRDDGIGGADPAGHGLLGLADRATALGGRLEVESPASGGTVVTATLPVPAAHAHVSVPDQWCSTSRLGATLRPGVKAADHETAA